MFSVKNMCFVLTLMAKMHRFCSSCIVQPDVLNQHFLYAPCQYVFRCVSFKILPLPKSEISVHSNSFSYFFSCKQILKFTMVDKVILPMHHAKIVLKSHLIDTATTCVILYDTIPGIQYNMFLTYCHSQH